MNLARINEWVSEYERDLKHIDALVATLIDATDPSDKMILETWLANKRKAILGKDEIYVKFKTLLERSN